MHLRKLVGIAGITALVAGSLSGTAFGHGDKERFEESQYRHDLMEHANYAISNIVQLIKGKASHDGHLEKLADIMALSASMTKDAFEKDTRGMEGHTSAKDAVWENWEDFAERADKYTADTAAFAEAAKSGDQEATMAAFKKAASNCKSCHDKYQD
ncbi:c-type cytochrome [Kordiimonas pumila]|uniref:C-type cytochrome n=1 Tax=Kordiimonas pumila TaxID=2161677 RepID=A0ABV7D4Z0_9PROT|nr:cytochrome c [Kordiimonas pumila]